MKVFLEEVSSGNHIEAFIFKAFKKDMPLIRDKWQFNWKQLSKEENADIYKLVKVESPDQLEGLLMITLINEEMVYMNNIEVAPHNYGQEGKYENVAGSLIAFACFKSFELGKNYYLGYLSFESKTSLIELYENKYGATYAMGQKMFFDPQSGKNLMKKYLVLELPDDETEEE